MAHHLRHRCCWLRKGLHPLLLLLLPALQPLHPSQGIVGVWEGGALVGLSLWGLLMKPLGLKLVGGTSRTQCLQVCPITLTLWDSRLKLFEFLSSSLIINVRKILGFGALRAI